MGNTIDWGQAAVNNTIGFGDGAENNTIGWGDIQADSWSPETNLTGTGGAPAYSNVNSFLFDGTDESIVGTTNYTELDNQTKATISFWINPTTDLSIPISIPSSGGYEQIQILLFATGEVRLRLYNNNSSQTAAGAITFGVWNHVLICVDLTQSTGSKCRIFIDGVNSFGNDGNSATDFSTSGGELSLGDRTISTSFAYTGNLDEVAFFVGQDLRSASDVAEIYNAGVPNNLSSLATISAPTTWLRMGENATWTTYWQLVDEMGTGYKLNTRNMVEATRTTDTP